MMTFRHSPNRGLAIGGAVLLAVTLAGCSGNSDSAAPTPSMAPSSAPASSMAPSAAATPASAGSVKVATINGSPALTDQAGRTLYVFTKDQGTTSACKGDCLAKWPVLKAPASAGDGTKADLLGTTQHPEGGSQVTYAGKPLYYFAQDSKAGDAKGQGLLDAWYMVAPDGSAITKKP